MKELRTHYDNLQITENASPEVIKGAYKYLSQKWHPDKNPDNRVEAERISSVINGAYAVLSDPQSRKEHDQWIRAEREQATRIQNCDRVPPTPAPAEPSPIPTQPKSGFFKRAFLMVLFTAALVMLLVGFPYSLINGNFKWSYIFGLAIWISIGRYAYIRLFHPEIVAEEKREKEERHGSVAADQTNAAQMGLFAFFTSGLLILATTFDSKSIIVSIETTTFAALFIGLLIWLVIALMNRFKLWMG